MPVECERITGVLKIGGLGFAHGLVAISYCFRDFRGRVIRTGYTQYARAEGMVAGQMIPIIYDLKNPTSVIPVKPSFRSLYEDRNFEIFLDGQAALVILGMLLCIAHRTLG